MPELMPGAKEASLTWLVLFTTTGTLVCCALPLILVMLGMGAVVVSVVSSFPILITLSLHKPWVFAISGILIVISAYTMYRPNRSCPSDPELGRLCRNSQRWNLHIFWLSVILWSVGFFTAFLALPMRIWVDSWLV